MTHVLIVASVAPREPEILKQSLARIRERGVSVAVACFFVAEPLEIDPALAEVRSFAVPTEDMPPKLRKAVTGSPVPRRAWLHASQDAWVREQLRRADVLIAMDHMAVHAVWEMAQRHPRADAIYGLAAGLRQLDKRLAGARPSTLTAVRRSATATASIGVRGVRRFGIRGAKGFVRRATGRKVMRSAPGAWFWRTAVSAPAVPDRVRRKVAFYVHSSLVDAERPELAVRATTAAASRLDSAQARADMLADTAGEEMRLGRRPVMLRPAVEAQLAIADSLLKTDPERATKAVSRATTLISNRVLHFDGLTSPLAEDPGTFLAPFRASAAMRKLAAPRGRSAPAAPPPANRPLRLLIVTLINDNFLHEIRARYESMPGVEVRSIDLHADPLHSGLTRAGEQLMTDVLVGGSPYGDDVEQWLRPHLDWADTVFIDWCQAQAALFTLIDPRDTRIVVRLHSFEAFNFWPHVVDFSRVDDMVFVSEHLRDLTVSIHPRLAGPGGPRLNVIPNAMDLRRFQHGPKPADARFTLGLVGIGQVAKDPRWAIEVVRILREHDRRYRLILVGEELRPSISTAARRYHEQLMTDFAELEPSGGIVRFGQTDDVPTVLEQIGVILSTSVRESFHCGLVEGTASGAIPVVRDWPFFADKPHGARTLFPPDWVVGTPEEAAKRILSVTATEQSWRDEAAADADHVIRTWDWPAVRGRFDELFLGRRVDD